MSRDESWKTINSGVKRSKIKVTSHRNITGAGLYNTIVSASFELAM